MCLSSLFKSVKKRWHEPSGYKVVLRIGLPLVASIVDRGGKLLTEPRLHQTMEGKPRIQSALARSAVSLELNHRTMVRLGLYAAQHSAGLRGLVTAPGAL